MEDKAKGLLVYDGDWLAFLIASVIQEKSVKVFDTEGKFVKEYKNKTLFTKDSRLYNKDFTVVPCQTLKPNHMNKALFTLRGKVAKHLKDTQCDEILITLGGKTNFRDRLNLPRKYKGSRANTERPLALKEVRDFLATQYNTIYSQDEEADDLISKYQFKSFKNIINNVDEKIVVCTLDKDARGTPGLLYDPNKEKLISISGLGELTCDLINKKRKLYGTGRKWFYSQLLTGDKADDYFPCDLYKTLTGNKSNSPIITDYKCFNLLGKCKTDKECLQVIKDTYYNWYKDITGWVTFENKQIDGNWLDLLQVYVDVVHMRRYDNDRLDIKELLTKLEII